MNGWLDTIAAEVRAESVVTRSRFIATLAPVADEEAADARIAAVRREFPDARHHGTAMVLGPDGQRHRSNDDGEPAGTTGAPLLSVLVGAELTDVVVIVTRYFGGTLLGAGGLVRAYGGVAGDAVAAARRRVRRVVEVLEVRVAHDEAGRLEHRMRSSAETSHGDGAGIEVGEGRYGPTRASFEVAVPTAELDDFHQLLASAGIAHDVVVHGPTIRAFDV